MSRSTKKFSYGMLYLFIFAAIIFVFYGFSKISEELSYKKNENQSGAVADVKQKEDLKSLDIQSVDLFKIGLNAYASALLVNPYEDSWVSDFSYAFKAYNENGEIVETISDTDSIAPGGKRFIYSPSFRASSKEIEKVDFEIADVTWGLKESFQALDVTQLGELKINIEENKISVDGEVKNQLPSNVDEIRLSFVFYDDYDFKIFVTGTRLTNISGFENRKFTLDIPFDSDFARKMKTGKVLMSVYN